MSVDRAHAWLAEQLAALGELAALDRDITDLEQRTAAVDAASMVVSECVALRQRVDRMRRRILDAVRAWHPHGRAGIQATDAAIWNVAIQLAKIDRLVDARLQAHEAQLRRDEALTGPEDEDALDRPPDPDSPWRRCTIEEVMIEERLRHTQWRETDLVHLRLRLAAWLCCEPAST